MSSVASFLVGPDSTIFRSGKASVIGVNGLLFQSPPMVIQASGNLALASFTASISFSKKAALSADVRLGGKYPVKTRCCFLNPWIFPPAARISYGHLTKDFNFIFAKFDSLLL